MESDLNIIYSSDDNYCIYMGVSILSVLENNKNFNSINIYVIDNNINDVNKSKLKELVDLYQRNILFIDFEKYKKYLNLNMHWEISMSSYARLFVSSMLPKNINKILYFDCDTLIVDSLDELWNQNINDFYMAGVCDTVPSNTKQAIGLNNKDFYINAGMLLINLKKWREDDLEKKLLNFIDKHNGNVIHHDQGVINGVIKSKKILPLRYNLMTSYLMMTRDDIIKYYSVEDSFYSESEIKEAIENPVYIHFTPGFTTRPWIKGCKHPKAYLYWEYLSKTPWRDVKAIKDNSPFYVKIINLMYRKLPLNVADIIYKKILKF